MRTRKRNRVVRPDVERAPNDRRSIASATGARGANRYRRRLLARFAALARFVVDAFVVERFTTGAFVVTTRPFNAFASSCDR
jgi:hypothetical protein